MSTISPYVEIHGPWVRHLRKARDKEIGELADEVGISAPHLRKIELGHSPRTSVTVYRALRDALGLTCDGGVFIRGNPWGVAGRETAEATRAGDAA